MLYGSRSIERHTFRYTKILSDGDSKAFNAVTSLNQYGTDIQIQKEDCENHVSKRKGTALRNQGKDKISQEKLQKFKTIMGEQ